MRHYKVNKITHTVFESDDEVPDDISYCGDWRDGRIGEWVLADDGCIIQVIRRGSMMKPKGKVKIRDYIGTCTGTFPIGRNVKMDTSKRNNIYSFGGDLTAEDRIEGRTEMTSAEALFVNYLARGMPAQKAYIKSFPTNNPAYANSKAMQLVKTERIRTAMKEELKPVMEELGIDPKYVIEGIKTEADDAEKADIRLKALFKLGDILDIEDKNTTKFQQITGAVFQGFTENEIEDVERPEIKKLPETQ